MKRPRGRVRSSSACWGRSAGRPRSGRHSGAGPRSCRLSLANWSLDIVVLISSFGLLGLPIPWRAVFFAYATAQVAGSLAPLPGGIGFVEGGMIGAFALAGSPVGAAVAATVIYRAVTCWLVAAVGSLMLIVIGRRNPAPVALDAPAPQSPGS